MPLPRQAIAEQSAERGRACSVLGVDRSSVRYRSVRPDDAALRKAMKTVAAERRVHVMLERQGWQVNQKKQRRLHREKKLASAQAWRPEACPWDAQAGAGG